MAKVTIPATGLWSAIAGILNAMFDEIYGKAGWSSYVDTQYTVGAQFSVTANTDVNLPNNAGTVIETQKPTDITSFYADGKISGRNGDGLAMQLFFYATPTAIDQYIDIWIDIGSGVKLYPQTSSFPKGTGQARGIMYTLPAAYTLGTWEANGGIVKVRSNAACTVYGMTYNFSRNSKAR